MILIFPEKVAQTDCCERVGGRYYRTPKIQLGSAFFADLPPYQIDALYGERVTTVGVVFFPHSWRVALGKRHIRPMCFLLPISGIQIIDLL